jgi:hypothetical protein
MRLLRSGPKSHLCDQRRRSKVTGLSDLMTLFYWPRVFILQTDAKSIQCFQKHAKLIENWFSRWKIQLTRVWELLTRRWNAWHWESHCVFTAGGERVKLGLSLWDSQCATTQNLISHFTPYTSAGTEGGAKFIVKRRVTWFTPLVKVPLKHCCTYRKAVSAQRVLKVGGAWWFAGADAKRFNGVLVGSLNSLMARYCGTLVHWTGGVGPWGVSFMQL